MLKDITDITSLSAIAEDGEVGRVDDLLFDSGSWTIRYLVIHTGDWLTGRKVLVPPTEVQQTDWSRRRFHISMTRKQIEDGPPMATDEPVSRQQEIRLQAHFGWEPYWTGDVPEGHFPARIPEGDEQTGDRQAESIPQEITPGDPNLRSLRETLDYHVQAIDADVGTVEGFVIDDETWVFRYLIVQSQDLKPERRLLLSFEWIDKVIWDEASFFVDMRAETIKKSPTYDPSVPIDREFEQLLHDHYQFSGYWQDTRK